METLVPPAPESPYAAEGTAAHALGELRLRLHLNIITKRQFSIAHKKWRLEHGVTDEQALEMAAHIDAYVALVIERQAAHENTQVLIEQRVSTGLPSCDGTADVVLVSPEHVEIIDLKYGQGVAVEAEGNSQLRLYAVGALEAFGDLLGTPETVYMTVFQPRLDHTLTEAMPAAELRAWRDDLLPVAEEALGENAHFGPSETACRWCPAAGQCAAQLLHVTEQDFGQDVDLLSPDQIAETLKIIPLVRDWMNAVERVGLDMAYSQAKPIPGYKVVLSSGKRYVADPAGVREQLTMLGYDEADFVKETVVGIGALEALVGRKNFTGVLGEFIDKTTGTPSLVPDTDKRAAINPDSEAAKEFK